MGLTPTRSAIFVGPPGVGKTLKARWLAAQLKVPLYVLDLTAVMSSLLGKSGTNLRAAIDFAKREPCVLLLDEIDAIAKRRSDDSDVGELKRLCMAGGHHPPGTDRSGAVATLRPGSPVQDAR
ncbi:hypothetical protein G6F50_016490 [Rhizopus delemar]|uniref:AAA+ ATPase domain-containing protein n=1 Tax=Rhizopus delemar TaxID=936053 RepID=A0A9P7C1P5_9FUNG|nr:hypothetical protein G6F50_016490 [Rhizopus delemar]